MKPLTKLWWLFIGIGMMIPFPVYAENRALLIGIGRYQIQGRDMPGIDQDIQMMEKVVKFMGFEDYQVLILKDRDATLSAIEHTMSTWLKQDVTPKDRVLVYITTHGSRIPDREGDESDGMDEVLITYDVLESENSLKNTLVDDRFGELLAQIPAGDVIVLVDACHSGTATRTLKPRQDVVPKFFSYKGMSEYVKKDLTVVEEPPINANYIALSAARDDETAVATTAGSLFTQGILKAVESAAASRQALTIKQLQEKTTEYIQKNCQNGELPIHHPQMSGNLKLADMRLIKADASETVGQPIRPTGEPPAPAADIIRSQLEKVADRASYWLHVNANQNRFKPGENMIITCQIPKDGYLNVITVGPDRIETVLFPNKFHSDNRVTAGTPITIPDAKDQFTLTAAPPFGNHVVIVFHTSTPINAYSDGIGKIDDIFKTVSERSVRAFQVVEKEADRSFGAAKLIMTIEP